MKCLDHNHARDARRAMYRGRVPMITVLREHCHLCHSKKLEEMFIGPWLVCMECRQVQSRYMQRELRPDEMNNSHSGPRYNTSEDLSELE